MIGWISALALAAAATDIPPPPADPRLEAFKAACVPHRQDLAKAAEALAADGWVRVADDDHPQLAAAMAVAIMEASITGGMDRSDMPPQDSKRSRAAKLSSRSRG